MSLENYLATYRDDGYVKMQNALPMELMRQIRRELFDVFTEATGEKAEFPENEDKFREVSTWMLWRAISRKPEIRNLVYLYSQRIPSFHTLISHPLLTQFVKGVGIKKASLREVKVQLYFPWERCFFQPVHQDINSLDSDCSVNFWVPLHGNDLKHSVSFWKGSHREGPVKHDAVSDERFGYYHATVPQKYLSKYPVESAAASCGDLFALNRLTFHASPRFEDSKYLRLNFVIIFDEIGGNGLYKDSTKYEQFTPHTVEVNEALRKKIREYLAKPPAIDWPAKLESMPA